MTQYVLLDSPDIHKLLFADLYINIVGKEKKIINVKEIWFCS